MDSMAAAWNVALLCVSALLAYLDFPHEPAIILASLMVIDFISGLAKAYVIGEKITSRRMKAGIASKAMLITIPLVMALGAKGVDMEMDWAVAWVISVMILAEMYSFISNVYCIRTKQSLPEWDVVHIIGEKLKKAIEALITK